MGGVGALDPAALRQWTRLRPAGPVPAVRRRQARPRRRGDRLPALQQLIARRRRWSALPLVLYGRAVTPRIFTLDALWYGALRSQLIRIVVVRDPSGRRHDEAFFCTDLGRDAAFVLQTYAARWTLEGTQPHCPHRSPEPLGCVAPAASLGVSFP